MQTHRALLVVSTVPQIKYLINLGFVSGRETIMNKAILALSRSFTDAALIPDTALVVVAIRHTGPQLERTVLLLTYYD